MTEERPGMAKETGLITISSSQDSPAEVLALRDESRAEITYIKIDYVSTGGNEAVIEFSDQKGITQDSNYSSSFEKITVDAGDRVILDDPSYEDLQNGLTANPNSDQDDEIFVTATVQYNVQ